MSTALKILYAEDDENDVFFVRRAFRQLQFEQLDVAENGHEAIEYLRLALETGEPLPSVMLLDLKLPYFNGHDVLAWIAERPRVRTMPLVVFTSSAQVTDIERAYRAGATAYVVKPSAAPVMVEFARHILRAIAAPGQFDAILKTCPGWQPPR